jgi:hypothetical protein
VGGPLPAEGPASRHSEVHPEGLAVGELLVAACVVAEAEAAGVAEEVELDEPPQPVRALSATTTSAMLNPNCRLSAWGALATNQNHRTWALQVIADRSVNPDLNRYRGCVSTRAANELLSELSQRDADVGHGSSLDANVRTANPFAWR